MIKSIKLSLFVSTLSLFLLACNEKSEASNSAEVVQESALQIAQAETNILDDADTTSTDSSDSEMTDEGSADEPADDGMGLNSDLIAELQQQCDELATEEQVSEEDKALFIEDCMVNKTNELNNDSSSEADNEEAPAEDESAAEDEAAKTE